MARAGIPKAKISILRYEVRQIDRRNLSKFAVVFDDDRRQSQDENYLIGTSTLYSEKMRSSSSTNWVPHPRTGIYFLQGQEWVMDDVPKGAASFGQTYWLRADDGVE
ncbi:hypothetical protein Patl1_35322 [Pistacia atlantica]|nr:hypothetical protein Patl1_35322 [Pistacia atlantica]